MNLKIFYFGFSFLLFYSYFESPCIFQRNNIVRYKNCYYCLFRLCIAFHFLIKKLYDKVYPLEIELEYLLYECDNLNVTVIDSRVINIQAALLLEALVRCLL